MKSKYLENTNSCTYHVLWFYVCENLWDVYDCGGGDTSFNTILAELEHLPCILPPPTKWVFIQQRLGRGDQMTTPNQRTCDSTWGCFQDAWNQLVSRWSKSRRVIMISYGKKTHATIHKLWEPHWIRGWHRIRLHLKHSDNMALTIEFGAEPGWKVGCFNPNEI